MKEIAFLNPENVTEDEVKTYSVREAARAVVLDDDNNVALLHATATDYYKLPGGGLDDDVDKIVALKRECIEEIGCD
jgi:8-oxo-dGTP pyrophosphatase MutT (NUDIX family)